LIQTVTLPQQDGEQRRSATFAEATASQGGQKSEDDGYMTQVAEATADGVDVDLGPEAIWAAKFTKANQENEALAS